MAETLQIQDLSKLALRGGLFIGAIYVVVLIVLQIVDPVILFTNSLIGILMTIIPIVLLVVIGLDTRKKIGGYWTYKQAFQCLIIMSFFLVLLTQIYNFILIKYYDPTLIVKIKDALVESISSKLSKFGMDQDAIDAAVKKSTTSIEEKMQPNFKNLVINFGISFLWYGVVSLIVAAIIKKVRPLYVQDESIATDYTA